MAKKTVTDKVLELLKMIADRLDPKKAIVEREAMVTVTKTVLDQTSEKSEKIKIRPFVTAPATVSVKYGMTQGMPNYSSIRADIMITCPCYEEEILDVYQQVRAKVDELMEKEMDRFDTKEETEDQKL